MRRGHLRDNQECNKENTTATTKQQTMEELQRRGYKTADIERVLCITFDSQMAENILREFGTKQQ